MRYPALSCLVGLAGFLGFACSPLASFGIIVRAAWLLAVKVLPPLFLFWLVVWWSVQNWLLLSPTRSRLASDPQEGAVAPEPVEQEPEEGVGKQAEGQS